MQPATRTPTLRLTGVVAALALLAVACGGSAGATPEVASAGTDDPAPVISPATTGSQPESDDPDTATTVVVNPLTTEDALLGYAECMRIEGVTDFPDPTFLEDGSFLIAAGTASEATTLKASATCKPLLDAVVAEFDHDAGGAADVTDQALEFSRCMRANGIDFPDPLVSAGGDVSIGDGSDGPALDPGSPEFQAALAVCQPLIFGGIGGTLDGGYIGGGGE